MLYSIYDHIEILFRYIPSVVLVSLIVVLLIGLVIIYYRQGFKKGLQQAALLLLFDYVALLFFSTVFYRNDRPERTVFFTPFWSYKAIGEGQTELLAENLLNILAFIPIGLLLRIGASQWTSKKVLATGVVISLCVEALQYLLNKGFCEIDDVIHNTIGCIIGVGLTYLKK